MAVRKSVLDHKYIREYEIGQWTYGTIAVLKEKETGLLRNCKTVPKANCRGSNVMSKLQALQELQHPHIASIADLMEDDKHYYIMSDHFMGGDVQDWMERLDEGNWLQEQTCAAYVRQAVLALCHCHSAQIYHRDMKPSSLLLTSKLPDASVKVADFGLAGILDPDHSIIQNNPNAYTVPEVLHGNKPIKGAAVDLWSIGAIAHALLVGHGPSNSSRSSGWASMGRSRSHDDEGWSYRSEMSQDFVRRLLRPAAERPSAAKALNHPWLKGAAPMHSISMQSSNETAREIRYKTLCYTLAVVLLPVVVPYRDFDQLRVMFQQSDSDRDGFIPRSVGQRLLLSRCNINEAVNPALNIVDVGKTDQLDLAATACADLIVREFFAAGPTSQPLVGPFAATDLAPRLLKRFFEVFGDRRQGAPVAAVHAANVKQKLRTATANDVQVHANVRYEELLACLPEDRIIDSQLLTTQLSASAGRGTPLGTDDELSPLQPENPWGGGFGGFDFLNMFHTCSSTN
eukprot:TRINITY_DN50592_c0_g1_i1.p1 TRINITY_DN50592_c0_g1~~TRINITY_DN50592_c0_g1_i1.p1  ORF type:complete len:514 (-),score=83.41 TRINITY_DN50592_c0_g1_i1:90-1631(-)